MHIKFFEPSRTHADILIPGGGYNLEAITLLLALLKSLKQHDGLPEIFDASESPGTPLELH